MVKALPFRHERNAMWGDPGCPGHPDVEAGIDETLRRAVENEVRIARLNETSGGFTRRRSRLRMGKQLFDNQRLKWVLVVPLMLILIVEILLIDPDKALFTDS